MDLLRGKVSSKFGPRCSLALMLTPTAQLDPPILKPVKEYDPCSSTERRSRIAEDSPKIASCDNTILISQHSDCCDAASVRSKILIMSEDRENGLCCAILLSVHSMVTELHHSGEDPDLTKPVASSQYTLSIGLTTDSSSVENPHRAHCVPFCVQ